MIGTTDGASSSGDRLLLLGLLDLPVDVVLERGHVRHGHARLRALAGEEAHDLRPHPQAQRDAGAEHEGDEREAGDEGEAGHQDGADDQRPVVPEELVLQRVAEVLLLVLRLDARHEHAGRQGDQERGDLRDEAVADGEDRVDLRRLLRGQIEATDADRPSPR